MTFDAADTTWPVARATDELLREQDGDGDSYFASGRQNNVTDLLLSMAAILASLVATVLAATGQVPPWISATAAAVMSLETCSMYATVKCSMC